MNVQVTPRSAPAPTTPPPLRMGDMIRYENKDTGSVYMILEKHQVSDSLRAMMATNVGILAVPLLGMGGAITWGRSTECFLLEQTAPATFKLVNP